MSLIRITDKDKIQETLRGLMLAPHEQPAPFFASLFTREHRPGGIIYEGARPMSSSTDYDNNNKVIEITYALTNGDSNYTRPIAYVKLSYIEYVEILAKHH